ncbi:MAG: IPT/TIG domain-containing protein [bacterium]
MIEKIKNVSRPSHLFCKGAGLIIMVLSFWSSCAFAGSPGNYISGDVLSWRIGSNLPVARGMLGAAAVDSRIYAIGGYNYGWNASVNVYDTAMPTQGWTSVTSLPGARGCLTVAAVGGKIYSIGGQSDAGFHSEVYVYNPLQPGLGWLSVSNLPVPLFRMASAVVNDKIYVLGGGSTNGTQSAVYEYDPQQPTQGWRYLNNLPGLRDNLAATSVDGKLYAIGGSSPTGFHSNVYVCDPLHPELGWASISNMPAARYVLGAASINGKVFAVGGYNSSQTGIDSVYMYDPGQPGQGWLTVSNLPAVKGEAPCVVVGEKMYFVSGGSAPLTCQSSVFEGSFTSGVSPSSGPMQGGTTVTINGGNLGNGSDITNVTLCGAVAAIISQSSSQVVVTSGVSGLASTGAVTVISISSGVTTREAAFIYTGTAPAAPSVLPATSVTLSGFCANWLAVGGAQSYVMDVSAFSNFVSCVAGFSNLTVGTGTTWSVGGLSVGSTYYYRLRTRQGGMTSTNSASTAVTTTPGSLNVSTGPATGGNTLTITGMGLGNGDITNVTICGVVALIQSQTSTSVTVVVGAGGSGVGTIVVQSISQGVSQWGNGYTYNPAGVIFANNLSWKSITDFPVARGLCAATVADGKIYAMGGYNGTWGAQVYKYDPLMPTQGWVNVNSMPVGKGCLAAVTVSGKVYAIGGQNNSGILSSVNVFDPQQPGLGWLSISNLPVPLIRMAAVVVNDKILVMGGISTNSTQSAVYVYDPMNPTLGWRHFNNLPGTRDNLAATVLDGKVYAIGGANPEGFYSDVFVCDPTHPELGWASISNMPASRYVLAAASVNGKVLAVGGFNSSQTGVDSVYLYDPTQPSQGWLSVSNLPTVKGEAPCVVINGKIFVISGGIAPLTYRASVFEGAFSTGVAPASGSIRGGTTVTIRGSNLGSGGDITSVRFCGFPASIVSQSASQVVVTTSASGFATNGAVEVLSSSYGLSSLSGGYAYTAAVYTVTSSAGAHGSISPAGVISVAECSAINYIVQADPGRHIAEVVVDGVSVGSFTPASNLYQYAFANMSSHHVIHATFNTPPVIGVTATPTNGVAPARVMFDFSSSLDSETNIVRCEVDKEGDGQYETVCAGIGHIIVEYGKPGNYLAAARVVDAYGADSIAMIPVTVWGKSPTASIHANSTNGPAPFAVMFVGTNSAAAENHQIVAYEWDFDGDGVYDRLSRTGVMSYIYRDAGLYVAGLRVTDDQGLQDKTSMAILVTLPVFTPPSVGLEASPASGKIPLPVTFVAMVTNGAAIMEYLWDFDEDGRVDLRTVENTATRTYSAVGRYQASVTVVDANGLSGSAFAMVAAQEASAVRVWIVQPKDGEKVSGNAVSVNANAVPASQVASVQIQYRQTNGAWFNISPPMVPPPADFKTRWCVTNLASGTVCELRAIAMDVSDAILTSEVVVVTVDAAKGSEGEDADGKHTKQATFGGNETAEVDVYDGTSVTVPLGAVESNLTVEVELTGVNTNPVNGTADGLVNINANRKVSLAGNPDLNKPVTIILPYSDTNNDGLVDGTTLPETTLTAHWFDTVDGKWKKTLSCEVDTSANHVKVTTYHLTEFGLHASQNLLSPASGGMLRSCTYEGTNAGSVTSLTDGNNLSYWKSAAAPLVSQEFVYGFTNYQGAICSEAVLYNYGEAANGLTNYSRNYEILVSMDNSTFTSVATGTLAMSEGALVVNMGNVTCRSVKLVLSSGYSSNAWELAEFEVHGVLTADPDGNGMSDAWEMRWFGAFMPGGTNDFEGDGLTDLAEFHYGSNPTTNDTDGDGMADAWEVQYGLQVATNDAAADLDRDGLSNLQEFIAGTNPTNALSVLKISGPAFDGPWSTNVSWAVEHWRTSGASVVWYPSQWVTQMSMNAERYIMEWDAVSGRTYQLYSTTNLLSGLWQTNSPRILSEGGVMTFTNDMDAGRGQFFRLDAELGP